MPDTFGIIFLGNSGVGKSLLANVLLDKEKFVHLYQASSVTSETEFEESLVNNVSVSVFNIPGLVDCEQSNIERNKREIKKAFQIQPNSVVVFVFGNQGGRIREEDLVAFNALNEAYDLLSKAGSMCLVVNDLNPRRHVDSPNYEGDTSSFLWRHLKCSLPIAFIDTFNPRDKSECEKQREVLMKVLAECRPQQHLMVREIELLAEKVVKLKEEQRSALLAWNKEKEALQSEIKEVQKRYEELKSRPPHVIEKVIYKGCFIL